ncbi:ROK family protein [Streptomyces sp. 6N223]|uniref:ROK family protein n=1 Tax=Streptomyces sp. 6N223 TaxID=3457412 RepID=UPI003FD45480
MTHHDQHGHRHRDRTEPAPVLALDIGGTKLAAGVVRADGEALAFAVAPTLVQDGPDAALKRLLDLGRVVLSRTGTAPGELLGVGVGCGGPLNAQSGVLIAPPHLPGWVNVPIVELVRDTFGRPAVLDNDGTAGAAGEWRFGAGHGSRSLLYLTVSTGIGGGAVLDGRTFRGAAGNGGEPGHVLVRSGGRPCVSCGRRGCLEAYASGTSIAERAREAVADARAAGRDTVLGGCDPLTAADVSAAARRGDPVAVAVWEETVAALGSGLTTLVNVFEPEVVVLGGGVTRAGEQLLGPVRRMVAEQAMGPAAAAARLTLASGGDRAGVLGAAAVAFERLGPTTGLAP